MALPILGSAMPTYEYVCTQCGNRFDRFQSIHDESLTVCEVCGGQLRKVFHPAGIVLKGSGFYKTDSRTTSTSSTSSSSSSSSTSSSKSSGSGSDSKPSGSGESSGSSGSSSSGSSSSGSSSSGSSSSTAPASTGGSKE